MAYIGVSPSIGVRRVPTYTATASQTIFSGAGAEGTTLSYKDSNFVDVYQNGIKLADADYTSTSGTQIVLAQAASVDDIVVVVVFDVFSVADTVSKADGGTFDGNVTMGGTLGVTGVPTFTGRSVHSGGITVANDGQKGSVGDADAMAISSSGVVTFSQNTVGAGGMDLILSSTLTSSSGNIDISSTYINSTYDEYFLTFNLNPDEDNRHLYLQVFVGGSAQGGSIYANEAQHIGGNSNTLNSDTATLFRFNSKGIGYESGEGISGQLLFQNVNDTDHPFCYSGFVNFYDTSGDMTSDVCGGGLIPANRASVVNGLRFYMSGGQATGDFKLYGLRK